MLSVYNLVLIITIIKSLGQDLQYNWSNDFCERKDKYENSSIRQSWSNENS